MPQYVPSLFRLGFENSDKKNQKILIVKVFDDTQHFLGIRIKFKDWKNENLETDIMTNFTGYGTGTNK